MDIKITEDDFDIILVIGLMRSIALLEDFVLNAVDASALATENENSFLNRVKERKNTGKNPIEVYLKPEAGS